MYYYYLYKRVRYVYTSRRRLLYIPGDLAFISGGVGLIWYVYRNIFLGTTSSPQFIVAKVIKTFNRGFIYYPFSLHWLASVCVCVAWLVFHLEKR